MKGFPDLPIEIETELGTATLGYISSERATKEYLCPLCDSKTELGEPHVVAVPKLVERLRRHLHAGCLRAFLEYKLTIKLHPKEPDAIRYWLGDLISHNRYLD